MEIDLQMHVPYPSKRTRRDVIAWFDERLSMATVRLWTDDEVSANDRVKAVFDDIRTTRKSDFVNNFWRALANQPALLERTWSSIKEVMVEPGALDPLTKELIYIAASTINGCSYCVHSHTAAARAKGLTEQQYAELLAVVGMAAETNAIATALQIPVDPEFSI
jgi:AhpD family alkylhydroperoxidase